MAAPACVFVLLVAFLQPVSKRRGCNIPNLHFEQDSSTRTGSQLGDPRPLIRFNGSFVVEEIESARPELEKVCHKGLQ